MIRTEGLLDRMGLHLNLTEGPAMTSSMRNCNFFCDKSGCFTGAFHRIVRYRFKLPDGLQSVVREEIESQVGRFLSTGSTFLHLDSHHHVHTDYSIARILLPIVRKNGFSSIRLSRNWGDDISLSKRIYKLHRTTYKVCILRVIPKFIKEYVWNIIVSKNLSYFRTQNKNSTLIEPINKIICLLDFVMNNNISYGEDWLG